MCVRNPRLTSSFVGAGTDQAFAGTVSNVGSQVRGCTQDMGFSGAHNPGGQHVAAGWEGTPCL